MISEDFFETLEKHYLNGLPFVAYRKPNDKLVKGMFQNDVTLHTISDYNESGFVFTPFDDRKDAILIPTGNSKLVHSEFAPLKVVETSNLPPVKITKEAKKQHKKLVKKGIKIIKSGELVKVVLSRKETVSQMDSDVISVFKRLLISYENAFVYCWYHPKVGLWLGATPETLVSIDGKKLLTMALAGTQNYIDFSKVVWGKKEREEQQLVVDFIVDSLRPIVTELKVSKLETIRAGNLLHLQTKISAIVENTNLSLKGILDALHPTPAICGLPRKLAKEFILEAEHYNRQFYTGFLGELNIKESLSRNMNRRNLENSAYKIVKTVTNLYVNLRCMQIENNFAHIYVGGGITQHSVAKYEWRETVNKAKTMKNVL